MIQEKLIVEPRGEREIVMTRAFAAPRDMVFEAYTRPELVRRWLGARAGWTMATCEVDLRVGGKYRYVWRHAERGMEMGVGGEYREVVAPERIVATETFDDAWYPGSAVITTAFREAAGRTTLEMNVRYESRDARELALQGMETGVDESFDALAALLAEK